jgi:hypothetical protein
MHGTFRSQITGGAVTTVRFATPAPRRTRWPSTFAALLAGSCIAVLPGAPPSAPPTVPVPDSVKPKQAIRPSAPASPALAHNAKPNRLHLAARASVARRPRAVIRIVLPAPTPMPVDIPSLTDRIDMAAAAEAFSPQPQALAGIPVLVAMPAKEPIAVDLPPALAASTPPVVAPRPVDIAQISHSEVRSLNVPQLHEPGLAAGGAPALSARIAAMQVTPPPPVRLRDSERAALLAEAPARMTVRIAGSALGKVDFRMSDARTIDVSLGNLLDILAGHYDAAEFARLRTSAAADAFVSFDQLRALGLNVRYNPAYDELQISG